MSDKRLLLELAAEEKRAALAENPKSSVAAQLAAQAAADQEYAARQRAGLRRLPIEVFDDSFNSAKGMLQQVAHVVPAMLAKGGAMIAEGAALNPTGMVVGQGVGATPNPLRVDAPAAAASRPMEDALNRRANALLRRSAAQTEQMRDVRSGVSLAAEDVFGLDSAADSAANAARAEERVAAGMHPALAGALRVGANLVDAGGNALANPTFASDQLAAQVPLLAMGPAARVTSAATGGAARTAAAQLAAQTPAREALRRAGMGAAADRAEQRAAAAIAQDMAAGSARNHVAAMGTGFEASAMYGDGANRILAMSEEEMIDKYPDIAEKLFAGGYSAEDVRNELISQVVTPAVAAMAPLSFGLMRGTTGFELNPLARPGARAAAAGTARESRDALEAQMRAFSGNVAGEMFEEGAQGGGSTLIQNVFDAARAYEGEVDVLGGVGEEIGTGAAVGGMFSGGVGGLGLSGTVAGHAADGAKELGLRAAKSMNAAGENTRAAQLQASVKEAEKEWGAQQQAAASAKTELSAMTTPPPVDLALPVDATVPEGIAAPAEDGAPADKLTAHARATMELLTDQTLADNPQRRDALELFVARNAREIQEQVSKVMQPALEATTDPEEQARLQAAIDHMSLFTESPRIKQIQEKFASLDQELVDRAFDNLPADLVEGSEAALLPDTQNALALIHELAIQAPEKISVEQAGRALAARSFMKPEQLKRLEAVQAFAQSRIPHAEIVAKATGYLKGNKSPLTVLDQVANTGFQEQGDQLLSVGQHFSTITTAMAEGRVEDAKKQFRQLMRWGVHAQDRARDGQSTALRLLEDGVPFDHVEELNTTTVDESGKKTKVPFKLYPYRGGSLAMVELMGADANLIADTIATLAQAYPELAGTTVAKSDGSQVAPGTLGRVDRVELAKLGTELNPAERARGNRMSRAMADAAARKMNQEIYVDAEGRVQLRDTDAMHPNQLRPSVLRADGKPMTPAQLLRLETGGSVRDLAQAPEAKPQEAAPAPAPEPTPAPPAETPPAPPAAPPAPITNKQWMSGKQQGIRPDNGRARMTVGDTTISYDRDDTGIQLNLIQTKKADRGNGSARRAMTAFLQATDAAGLPVSLSVAEQDPGTSREGLVNFYTSFGFVPTEGDNMGRAVGAQPIAAAAPTAAPEVAPATEPAQPSIKAERLASYSLERLGRLIEQVEDSITLRGGTDTERANLAALQAEYAKRTEPVAEDTVPPAISAEPETNDSEPRALRERFQGVVEFVKDLANATVAETRAFSNRLIYAFRPAKQAPGLFDRFPGGIPEILAAIDDGTLGSKLPERYRHLAANTADLDNLRSFLNRNLTEVAGKLNEQLNEVLNRPYRVNAASGKGETLGEAFRRNANPEEWNFANRQFLHAVQFNEDGTAEFTPEVLEALAVSSLNWTLENYNRPVKPQWDKLERIWNRGMPPNLVDAYRRGHFLEDGPRTIARDLQKILGIEVDPSQPDNLSQEVLNSLALMGIEALKAANYVQVQEVEVDAQYTYRHAHAMEDDTPPPRTQDLSKEEKKAAALARPTVVHFVRFNEEHRWDHEDAPSPPPSRGLMAALFNPYSEAVPSIGQPPAAHAARIKGNAQRTSAEQQEVERKHNEQGFTLNLPLLNLLDQLGWGEFQTLRGYTQFDDATTNTNHASQLKGKNQSIAYQDTHFRQLHAELQAYAATNGVPLDQVKVYWSHRTITNGRVMAQGVAPQNDKLFRELFTLAPMTITKGDVDAENRLFAAITQGLGLGKLEQLGIEKSADKLRAVLQAPELTAMLDKINGGEGDLVSLAQALSTIGITVDNTKAIHALKTLNDYQKANDGAEFAYNLTAEIDGVNNGPHNAGMQFLTGYLTQNDLRQMEQGGVFIGQGEPKVLADRETKDDRYTDTSKGAAERGRTRLADPTLHDDVKAMYQPLGRLMAKASLTTLDEEGRISDLTRAFGKAVLVPVGYMAGQASVSNKLAAAIMDGFYEEISAALREDRDINAEMIADIRAALEIEIVEESPGKGEPKELRAYDAAGIAFPTTQEGWATFSFSPAQIAILRGNVDATIGRDAFRAAEANLAAAREGLGLVVEASQMLAALSDALLDSAYEARRQELIAAGELGKFESLSRDQAQEVLDSLSSALPNVALPHTDEDEASQGLSAVVKDKGKPFTLQSTRNGKGSSATATRTTNSPLSGMKLNVQRTGIGDPRVALAPLLVIGTGDVSMVHTLKQLQGLADFLQIWDGLDVHPEKMGELGVAANKAAFETWNNTALDAVVDMLRRLDPDLAKNLSPEAAGKALQKAYSPYKLAEMYAAQAVARNEPMDEARFWKLFNELKYNDTAVMTKGDPVAALLTRRKELQRTLSQAASFRTDMWTALKELGVSVDQMAGGGTPFVHPGSGEQMTHEQVVAAVNARVIELQARRVQVGEELGRTNQAARDMRENVLVSELANGETVRKYTTAQAIELLSRKGMLASKAGVYALKLIKPLLPANLTVHIGTPAAVQAIHDALPVTAQTTGKFDGLYVPGSTPMILVRNFSPVTLMHELIHAATDGLLSDYFAGRLRNMTGTQKGAIAHLEKMARAFMELDSDHPDAHTRSRFTALQEHMAELARQNDLAGMVGEFLAYGLSEPKLQRDLARRTLPEVLRNIKDQLISVVRRMLGLPRNAPMDDWLSELVGQMHLLTSGRGSAPSGGATRAARSQGTLREAMEQAQQEHMRLKNVSQELDQLMALLPDAGQDNTESSLALAQHAADALRALTQNGFGHLDATQRQVAEQIQMVFASVLPLDPALYRGMQAVYDHVMPQLTAQDLMDNRDSTSEQDITEGEIRLKALRGEGTKVLDAQGRSNLLANFVALATVDPVLRDSLERIAPPALHKTKGDIDSILRDYTKQGIDAGATLALGTRQAPNQRAALDTLRSKLSVQQKAIQAREQALALQVRGGVAEKAEAKVKAGIEKVGDRLQAQATKLRADADQTKLKAAIANVLDTMAANTSDARAAGFVEALVGELNKGIDWLPLRQIGRELLGTAESAMGAVRKLNQSKQQVSTTRQRLREEAPKQVKSWFTTPLSRETWRRLHLSVGRVDLAAVWGLPRAQLLAALTDPAALSQEIATLTEQLGGDGTSGHLVRNARWLEGADDLAHWLVHKANKSKGMLYRNAEALAHQYGSGAETRNDVAEAARPILDQLVTLMALQKLAPSYRAELKQLIETQPEAMDKLVNTMRAMAELEARKDGEPANRWKGYVPESMDPRKQVRLATPEQAKELLLTGWTHLASYQGDAHDKTPGLAYYVSTTAGEVTYNQGALQMVVNTAGGTNLGTGYTLSNVTGLVISDPKAVARITEAKKKRKDTGSQNLLPVLRRNIDTDEMEVIAYERTLNAGLVQAHTKGDSDLAVGIGIWMGRQAEEEQARMFNAELGEMLATQWEAERDERGDEYVQLNGSDDPINKDTWNSIPPQTQKMLLVRFNGKVMVRNDLRDNMVGYRNSSVRDIFTGYSGLNPDARKMIENMAYGLMGKNAYKFLSMAEDTLQGLVGGAKDVIVVRSGVVAFVNILANQVQLLSQGVPITELPRQFKIAKQIETYLRNEHRLAAIHTELRGVVEDGARRQLQAEIQRLADENSRLAIYDLIQAGELPTIAEGLSESDEYTLIGDATKWLEERTKNLPKGLTTAGRYALITRDTALYQGLNRMIQFGDLMAKQLTYEHQLRLGKTKEQALNYVQDNFVNYNVLPGRTRTYLEQMGVLWFWNYKLRIQKIFFRAIRENPLRALTMFAGADVAGIDSLLSSQAFNTNISYSTGLDQLQRAHQMLLWNQVTGN